jgi:hypothetical protein
MDSLKRFGYAQVRLSLRICQEFFKNDEMGPSLAKR